MRISDWSSDVCSSDLRAAATCAKHAVGAHDDRAGFSEAFDAEMIVSGYRGRLIAHLMPFQTLDGDMVLDSDGNAIERPPLFAACARSIGCPDRKSVVLGTSVSVRVDLGGRRIVTKKTTTTRFDW